MKWLNLIRYLLVIFLLLLLVFFTTVQRGDFRKSLYYSQTLEAMDSAFSQRLMGVGDLKAGWALQSITPDAPVSLTGGRKREPFQGILDSIYVRCAYLEQGNLKVGIFSYDLWFIHPHLSERIREAMEMKAPGMQIYLTATHTHSSIGGWGDGLMGDLVIGGNDEHIVDEIVLKTLNALDLARDRADTTGVSYHEAETTGMVRNRLDPEGPVDEKLRWISLDHQDGRSLKMITFPAHAVYVGKKKNMLSADYPGWLTRQLDDSLTTSMYMAGAVGNHSPIRPRVFSEDSLQRYVTKLSALIRSSVHSRPPVHSSSRPPVHSSSRPSVPPSSRPPSPVPSSLRPSSSIPRPPSPRPFSTSVVRRTKEVRPPVHLSSLQFPLYFGTPQLRVTRHLRLRPWLFGKLLGTQKHFVNVLKIGDILMVGLPVELSGDYMADLENYANEQGLNLIITSFNGTYNGYVNPGHYYDSVKKSETRTMNWAGPEGGSYVIEIIREVIKKGSE